MSADGTPTDSDQAFQGRDCEGSYPTGHQYPSVKRNQEERQAVKKHGQEFGRSSVISGILTVIMNARGQSQPDTVRRPNRQMRDRNWFIALYRSEPQGTDQQR